MTADVDDLLPLKLLDDDKEDGGSSGDEVVHADDLQGSSLSVSSVCW